ncbi:trypsin-like [Colias croceus]|uniref:trypsin-like n=1 Tax=Colias crocea TaxID=72248 RepID=UPI001E27E97E|nr:trypsin-like [Colias croceus]
MNKMILLLLFITVADVEAARRIVASRDAYLNEFPFAASWGFLNRKLNKYRHMCTCSILSPTWTLSAGHCVDGLPNNISTVIRYSSHLPSVSGMYSGVLQIITHPRYHTDTLQYDICLFKTEPINITQYATISAVDHTTLIGHEAVALGYGITNDSATLHDTMTLNKPLQVMNALLIRCSGDETIFPLITVCVTPKCDEIATLTKGDSGGPIIHKSGIVGVTSWGMRQVNTKKSFKKHHKHYMPFASSGVITVLSSSIDWISSVTSN